MAESLSINDKYVGDSNPLPTKDVVSAAGIGVPADAAWTGSGDADLISIAKALYDLLIASLTVDVVDNGGVPISTSNPFQVQIGQLLASQDSVQQYALSASTIVPVRVPTLHTTNVASSMAANAQTSIVSAPSAGNKIYVHHVRVSMEVASNAAGSLFTLLDGTSGTVIERFRVSPGVSTDLWFPNGTLQLTAANALSIKNSSGATCTNVEWACSYAVGP